MSNLSSASAVSLGTKPVKKLTLQNKVVWEKSGIINWLPRATDADRTTIYNGIGYRFGERLSSSGSTDSNSHLLELGLCASGYIPALPGDILRIQGFDPWVNTNFYVIAYDANNVKTGYATINSAKSPYTITLSTSTFGTNFNAIRFCVRNLSSESIVTINQELP